MASGWFNTDIKGAPVDVDEEIRRQFALDNAVGSTAAVKRRIKVRTPVKLTRAQFNEFAMDEMAQFKQQRIRDIRNKNLRSR